MNDFRQAQKMTVLYERLSKDDDRDRESCSIANQRALLEEYAEKNGFVPYINIADDGYSGTNFRRPGWEKLIDEVEAGNVGTLILKDLTRMGRNYLRTGMYREMFAERGVRLIALGDNYDSDNGEDDFTPFKEIIAEMYAKDTSKKIKSVIYKKGRDGIPIGVVPLYGFRKDPEDKNRRIIDDEAAEVVRRIFRMTVDGKGPWQIAKTLMDEKVERPSYYLYRVGIVSTPGKCNFDLRYNWRGNTVMTILKKREYMGDLVNFKTHTLSFKNKKQIYNAPEDQLVFEGAMPAIVERATWELAQKLRQTTRRPKTDYGEANPLTGLLYCSDCGGKLHNRRSFGRYGKDGEATYPVDSYECTTYRNNAGKFLEKCSIHFIRTSAARDIILTVIREVSTYARMNEAEFVKKIREMSVIQQDTAAKAQKRQLAKNERRIAELDVLFRKVYEDNAIGKLSDERFEQMSSSYEQEQAALKEQTAALRLELEAFERDSVNVGAFLELARRYTDFTELTTPMLNEFISKVIVHEADKSSGERVQKVDVYLNFIGKFVVPGSEPKPLTPEEQAAEEKRLAQKRRKNEILRKSRAKKRAEKAAQAVTA